MADRIEKFNALISGVQEQKKFELEGATKSAKRRISNKYRRKITKLQKEYHRFERMMELSDSQVRLDLNNERLPLKPFLPSVLERTLDGYQNWQSEGQLLVKNPGWDYLQSVANIYHRIMKSRGKGRTVEDRTPRQRECVDEIISRCDDFFKMVARDIFLGKTDEDGQRVPVHVFGNKVNLKGFNYDLEDAAQDAALGCFRSFHTYKPSIKFSTWLYGNAGGSIIREMEEKLGVIHIPVYLHLDARRKLREAGFDLKKFVALVENEGVGDSKRIGVFKGQAIYASLTGDYDDVSQFGGGFLDDSDIEESVDDETITIDELALQASVYQEPNQELLDIVDSGVVPPDEEATVTDLGEKTRYVLSTLTPREEKVLRLRFGISEKYDHTLEETAVEFDQTRERIRQIEAKALRKLRHPSRACHVRGYNFF